MKQLGKFEIIEKVGQGAMGVVYKAVDPVIQRPVAIKTIHKSLLGDADPVEMAARFRNEAQAVGRLSHPGIVSIYEYGEDADIAYIAARKMLVVPHLGLNRVSAYDLSDLK